MAAVRGVTRYRLSRGTASAVAAAAVPVAGPSCSSSSRSGKRSELATDATVRVVVRGLRGARTLGRMLAAEPRAGDVLLLRGDVGAGKTETCRWYIRQVTGVPQLVVPSPTYLLQQVYESEPPVHHFDLYRLPKGSDMRFLDMEESFARCVSLVEWPERLEADALPSQHLDVRLTIMKSAGTGNRDARTMDTAQRHRRQRRPGGVVSDDDVDRRALKLRKRMSEILSLEARDCDDVDDDYDDEEYDDDGRVTSTTLPETCALARLVELRPHGRRWAAFTSALEAVLLESGAAADNVHSGSTSSGCDKKDGQSGHTMAPSFRAPPLELADDSDAADAVS